MDELIQRLFVLFFGEIHPPLLENLVQMERREKLCVADRVWVKYQPPAVIGAGGAFRERGHLTPPDQQRLRIQAPFHTVFTGHQ